MTYLLIAAGMGCLGLALFGLALSRVSAGRVRPTLVEEKRRAWRGTDWRQV